ncbi:MAG: ubiquinone/menaquinone biosynthesis methyltransferase [Ardenticatenia bacterium]|nr:ubiquinone/menaquinone biosynthesis methyltransferase [Ardenticatenia bacterium]
MTFESASEKRQYVQAMFDRIAPRYNLMNRLMTGGQDTHWRKHLVREARLLAGGNLLDVATGTGGVAFAAIHQQPELSMVVGIDFSLPMLGASQDDVSPNQATFDGRLQWAAGDTMYLPFPNNTFDAVTSAFLIRNVTDVAATLSEQRRVTRAGGRVIALDVPRPPDTIWGGLFRFYFHQVVPRLGGLISGHRDAYVYLPRSADAFLRPDQLASVMEATGLRQVRYRMLMAGTVALHMGVK